MKKLILLLLYCSLLAACESGPVTPFVDKETVPMQDKMASSSTPSLAPEDSMQLQFDSSVAEYHSHNKNKTMLKVMSDVLEGRFSHFQQRYGIENDRKVIVKLYPDYASMKPYLNGDPGVPFISGTVVGDTIMIQAQNPEDDANLIIHEYTHFVMRQIGARVPDWLEEGIATYEGMQMLDEIQRESRIYSRVRVHLLKQQPPGFAELEPPTYAEFVSIAGYEFGCLFVEYLISEFGSDKLIKVIREGADWRSSLGMDQKTIESGWHAYLLSKYGPNIEDKSKRNN